MKTQRFLISRNNDPSRFGAGAFLYAPVGSPTDLKVCDVLILSDARAVTAPTNFTDWGCSVALEADVEITEEGLPHSDYKARPLIDSREFRFDGVRFVDRASGDELDKGFRAVLTDGALCYKPKAKKAAADCQ